MKRSAVLVLMVLGLSIPGSALGEVNKHGIGASVGGGLEVGSQRVAFFGDYEFTLLSLFDETMMIGDLTLGVMLKF